VTAKATTRTEGDSDADDGVLRIGESAEEPKYEVLFRVRGKEYEGRTNPPGSVLFRYLDIQRKRSSDTAMSWLVEKILKPDAYAAITEDESVSRPDFDRVCEIMRNLLFGRDSSPKPPASLSQRRTSG
jgi:hypothetical protein